MSFTDTIKRLREEKGVSQADVAAAIGIARATYASLEAERRPANLDEVNKLAEYYQISPADLITGQASMVNEPIAEYHRTVAAEEIEPRDISQRVSPEKLREVLLYVLDKIGGKPNVGETVLYKLLYFIDFDYYEKHGKSITGLTYIHNHYGPSPVSDFRAVVNDMRSHDELDIVETKFFHNTQKKYLSQAEPELQKLSASEIKHIDEELARLGDKTASELTDLSHKDTPWIVAKQGKPIDYRDTFYRTNATAVTEPDDEL